MRVHALKLICSTGVSNCHQTFIKLAFCVYNKLRLHASILAISSIQPYEVQSVSLERE